MSKEKGQSKPHHSKAEVRHPLHTKSPALPWKRGSGRGHRRRLMTQWGAVNNSGRRPGSRPVTHSWGGSHPVSWVVSPGWGRAGAVPAPWWPCSTSQPQPLPSGRAVGTNRVWARLGRQGLAPSRLINPELTAAAWRGPTRGLGLAASPGHISKPSLTDRSPGPSSLPHEISHCTRPPVRQGHPSWLTPLS